MSCADLIVWIDCEMTGLDLRIDALVEIACIVTDANLVELDAGMSVVIKPPESALANMGEIVTAMHTESGLLHQLDDGITLAQAQQTVMGYLTGHVTEPRKAQLAGSSVYVDRGFLARDMSEVDEYLHYRVIDVSTLKELVRRWYPRVYHAAPEKHGGHRALADTRESIAELRYYRDAIFPAPPGPDNATARSIAARHQIARL